MPASFPADPADDILGDPASDRPASCCDTPPSAPLLPVDVPASLADAGTLGSIDFVSSALDAQPLLSSSTQATELDRIARMPAVFMLMQTPVMAYWPGIHRFLSFCAARVVLQ